VYLNPVRTGLLPGLDRRRGGRQAGCQDGAQAQSAVSGGDLLAQVSELAGPEHRGEDIRQSAEEKAERLVQEELGRLGWSGQNLAGRPKGDARKVRIAARLRQETTMTLAWIARRLQMGTPGHVSCLLYRTEPEAGDGKSENKLF